MPDQPSIDPVDFDEAIAAFRKRVVVSKATWERMEAAARWRAFFVSDVAQADVVHDVWKAIDRAVAKGTSFEDFKREVGQKLIDAWGDDVDNPAWRLETIFRSNVQQAYAQGRYRQQQDQAIKSLRPYAMFDAILDGRETKVCREADGTILPLDHPWWEEHTPPCHFNCRSGTISLSEEQAKELGGATEKPTKVPPGKGFGGLPVDDSIPPPKPYPKELEKARKAKAKTAPPKPKPKPAGLREGAHVGIVDNEAGLPKADVSMLLKSVSDEGTLAYLEQRPINVLRLKKVAKIGSDAVYGSYTRQSGSIELSTGAGYGDFGQALKAGSSWSTSTVARDHAEYLKSTLLHELGHHLHLGHSDPKVDLAIATGFRKRAKTTMTRYAAQSEREYFAESYAAYRLFPSELKASDPVAFAMVEKVLRLRGILPP